MTRREKVNAVYDRYRGLILIVAPIATIVPALLALFAVMGFGPLETPNSRLVTNEAQDARDRARAEAIADSLRAHIAASDQEHAEIARRGRNVDRDLCVRYRDTPILLATFEIDCAALLSGRRP